MYYFIFCAVTHRPSTFYIFFFPIFCQSTLNILAEWLALYKWVFLVLSCLASPWVLALLPLRDYWTESSQQSQCSPPGHWSCKVPLLLLLLLLPLPLLPLLLLCAVVATDSVIDPHRPPAHTWLQSQCLHRSSHQSNCSGTQGPEHKLVYLGMLMLLSFCSVKMDASACLC